VNTNPTPTARKSLWAGRIISAVQLGYSESIIFPLGLVLLLCTGLYAIPRTSILGAILLTGYPGGAVATHVRVGAPVFSITFPVIIGCLIWLGLFLRDSRLRALVPLRAIS
jgi:hypothetical protein